MFKSVFIPIDTSEPGSWAKALPMAIFMARADDAPLTIATVVSDVAAARDVQWSPIGYRRMVETARIKLMQIADKCGYDKCEVMVGGGPIGGGTIDLAKQAGADLIVLSSHTPGALDYLIGANALHIVRHAKCSVFVVRE